MSPLDPQYFGQYHVVVLSIHTKRLITLFPASSEHDFVYWSTHRLSEPFFGWDEIERQIPQEREASVASHFLQAPKASEILLRLSNYQNLWFQMPISRLARSFGNLEKSIVQRHGLEVLFVECPSAELWELAKSSTSKIQPVFLPTRWADPLRVIERLPEDMRQSLRLHFVEKRKIEDPFFNAEERESIERKLMERFGQTFSVIRYQLWQETGEPTPTKRPQLSSRTKRWKWARESLSGLRFGLKFVLDPHRGLLKLWLLESPIFYPARKLYYFTRFQVGKWRTRWTYFLKSCEGGRFKELRRWGGMFAGFSRRQNRQDDVESVSKK